MPATYLEQRPEQQPTLEMIEASLLDKRLRLKFRPALKTMFERDTASDRRWMYTLYNTISLIVYDLMIFSYFRALPDVAVLTMLVQLLIVTPLSIAAIYYNRGANSSLAREGLPSLLALSSLVAGMIVNHQSSMPVAMLYSYSPVVTVIYVNVVVAVRFKYAFWTTALVFLITAINLAYMHEAIPNARGSIMSAIAFAGVMTLLANYKVDKELRRAYLLNARERLHRNEIARFAEQQARDHEARQRTSQVLEAGTLSFSDVATTALDDFAQVSGEMRTMAEQLANASDVTAQRAASMAAGAQMASSHVAATAVAISELATSASAVSRGVAGSIEMANQAVERAGHTAETIERLSSAAAHIGAVVTTIHAIAQRTKLLAVNAMIEAARAGPAGLGFSVVAEEVKALALQAARATTSISDQVGAIQLCTTESVSALQVINSTINQINSLATEVFEVMRQQATATAEISRNVASAALSTQSVSGTAGAVQQDAEVTGSVAMRVLHAAAAVGDREVALRTHVADFLIGIRAG